MDSSPTPPVKPVIRRPIAPKPYIPALGSGLKVLLFVTFASVAVLGATAAYTGAVKLLDVWAAPQSYSTVFTVWMFLAHGLLGVVLFVPFVVFGVWHYVTARKRDNKAAIRRGIGTLAFGLLIGATGFALFQVEGLPQLPTGSASRLAVYWLHVLIPLAAVWAYVAHRKAGPRIKWGVAKWWGVGVAAFTGGMLVMHSQSPHRWYAEGPKDGEQYFHPSESRTADGKFIPADSLMSDQYCMRCHEDIYRDHLHSAHKFSSFNNPAYLASVKETREVGLKRDGSVQASRWCAGCHDPVPFFSGAFDDPNFDLVNHPTAHAGITCVVCHSITHVHGTTGNAAYTIEAPDHYPFAFSDSTGLQALSDQLVKAKPDVHKKTFLKPFHKSSEFCSTCHKVSLPVELNHYKDFLRGQNHYDTFLLSGASGIGARSFYYPPKAFDNCSSCHMPGKPVTDLAVNFAGATDPNTGQRLQKNHIFPGANTGLFEMLKHEPRYAHLSEGLDAAVATHTGFLTGTDPSGKDKVLRVDIFGLKEGGTAADKLVAPLRPNLPALTPGRTYVIDVNVRTLFLGHPFSQGTVDSNEIWVDFRATTGGKEIARSGATAGPDDTGPVDEWAHFINVLMLDRNGNRIDRRNPQDIFTPLYNHQIPPGAANVLHYRLDVPKDATGPIELTARVRYRKFDDAYMRFVYGGKPYPKIPVVEMCSDTVVLPVVGGPTVSPQESPIKVGWQRWNDYGIANLIEGGPGSKLGNYRQAEAAFRQLLGLGVKEAVPHAHLNLARVYIDEGRLTEAAEQLRLAEQADPKHQWWTRAWLTAIVNSETATSADLYDAAIANLEKVVDPNHQPEKATRGFDFSRDYIVLNLLANRLYKRREFEPDGSATQKQFVLRAVAAAERVLAEEAEDVEAHDLLRRCYAYLSGYADGGSAEIAETPSVAELPALVQQARDAGRSAADRLVAARALARGFDGVSRQPPRADQPKFVTLRSVWRELRPAYHAENDAEVKTALAAAMAALHRELHAILKPDEVARSAAARIYRAAHPAANYSARNRVVYPTTAAHRQTILLGEELLTD